MIEVKTPFQPKEKRPALPSPSETTPETPPETPSGALAELAWSKEQKAAPDTPPAAPPDTPSEFPPDTCSSAETSPSLPPSSPPAQGSLSSAAVLQGSSLAKDSPDEAPSSGSLPQGRRRPRRCLGGFCHRHPPCHRRKKQQAEQKKQQTKS